MFELLNFCKIGLQIPIAYCYNKDNWLIEFCVGNSNKLSFFINVLSNNIYQIHSNFKPLQLKTYINYA